MTSQIYGPPNTYDAGLEFNYFLWTAKTVITLTNVPWNNDYRDVVSFPSTAALNTFIDRSESTNTAITNAQYAKVNEPIRLQIPFTVASRYNYVRVFNPAQPIAGDTPRFYYYFILDVIHVAPSTTELIVQIDLWQSFSRQVQLGRSYIERGHIGIANVDNFRNYGRDFLTNPEGLDVGSEYQIVHVRARPIMNTGQADSDLLVLSTTQLVANPGDRNNPNLEMAHPVQMQTNTGVGAYIWEDENRFNNFVHDRRNAPWILKGIISVTMIPNLRRYRLNTTPNSDIGAYRTTFAWLSPIAHNMFHNWRDRAEISNFIPPRYRHLKKFYTSPYMVCEVTTLTGTPVVLKPESWNAPHAEITEQFTILPPGQRISFYPAGYNSTRRSERYGDRDVQTYNTNDQYDLINADAGEHWDVSVIVNNLPTIPVLNDNAINFLASNAATLAYSHRSADWSQQKALRGAQVSYDQATSGMQAAYDTGAAGRSGDAASVAIENQSARDSALINIFSNGIGSIGTGIAGGAVAGGGAGAAVGGVLGGLSAGISGVGSALGTNNAISTANKQLANRNATGIAQQNAAMRASTYARDTNKSLADYAAKGDYENTIAGLNAKVQDAAMIQPTTSGQAGGDAHAIVHGGLKLIVKWKMIDQAAISRVGEYWLRYGYSVMRFASIPNDFQVMTHFTYWKMSETYLLQAPIPESFKQSIRGIFEKGVTVWAKPEYIGNIDPANNQPLPDIRLEGYTPPAFTPEPAPEAPTSKPIKRKRKVMIYSTNDENPGVIYAIAGMSPGTNANWIETRSAGRVADYLAQFQMTAPVALPIEEYRALRAEFLSPVTTLEVTPTTPSV